jgi:hypothetical protein
MPLLIKDVIPEGTFLVSSNKGRIRKTFDKDYLNRIAATGNAMLAAGLKIPAPFDHKKAAVPKTSDELDKELSSPEVSGLSTFDNAGYYQAFLVSKENGKDVLQVVLDAPGSKDDATSPYFKALNTAKEVSISLNDEYMDGLGRVWKDAPLHIALVNHPVVPNQKGFEECPAGSNIVNMSMMESDDSETLIGELKVALREAANLILPDSCNATTFLRDLLVAASQLRHSKPNNDTIEPVPVYMSIGESDMAMSQEQALSIVSAKVINPTTKAPYTMEDLGFKTKDQVDLSTLQKELSEKEAKLNNAQIMITAFSRKLVEDTKNAIQRRVNDLVARKVVTKEYADAHLLPKVAFEMSIKDGSIADHPLEMVLSTLEATAPTVTPSSAQSFDGTIRIPSLDTNEPMDEASLEAAMKDFEEFLS